MKVAVCTLFEHHYHLGAAVLVNSLCRGGFTGPVYAGFRGPLPPWAQGRAKPVREGQWEMQVTPGVRIVFLELKTPAHFTNYKPDYLLRIQAMAQHETDAAVYCDPDIVFTGSWGYVEEWLSCGVALCEDVNSPVGQDHPRRVGWRRFFQPLGFELKFRGVEYANGGFIGLRWEDRKILTTWQHFMSLIATSLGGTDIVGIDGGRRLTGHYGFADCFKLTDQDALNATLEACPEIPASFLGPQTMGFVPGRPLLPHALGPAKPWLRRYVREAFRGSPPNAVDKAFWRHTDGAIRPFTPSEISSRRLQIQVGAGLGRFIRRA